MQTQTSVNSAPALVSNEQQQRDAQNGVTGIVPETSQAPSPTAAPPAQVAELNAYLQEAYGVDLGTAMQYVQQAHQQQQPAAAAAPPAGTDDITTLKNYWKVDDNGMQERMRIVTEQFAQLPEDVRPLYDTVEGAQLLWQRYETQNPGATPVDRGSSAATPQTARYQFTRSQLYDMSESEYRAQDAAITYAEANGLVHEDR